MELPITFSAKKRIRKKNMSLWTEIYHTPPTHENHSLSKDEIKSMLQYLVELQQHLLRDLQLTPQSETAIEEPTNGANSSTDLIENDHQLRPSVGPNDCLLHHHSPALIVFELPIKMLSQLPPTLPRLTKSKI